MKRRPKLGSVRNVVTGKSDHYTGRVPFARLEKTVAYDSVLEHDFLMGTAAFERDVTEINSQPFWVEIDEDPKHKIWLPDYYIKRASGVCELIEVKPLEQVRPECARFRDDDPATVQEATLNANIRFRALQAAAVQRGFRFRLVTETEIRVEPRLSNAAMLLRYAGNPFPAHCLIEARIALNSNPVSCVSELQSAIPEWDAFPIALHFAWSGDLEFDPTSHFSRESRFVRVGNRLLASPVPGIAKGAKLHG